MKTPMPRPFISAVSIVVALVLLALAVPAYATPMDTLVNAFDTLHWIGYAPTNFNPNTGVEPPPESIDADLQRLKQYGFQGIVTYACNNGTLSKTIPEKASALGLKMIIGVWDPKNLAELNSAKALASNPNVLGFCVGNEGLKDKYNMSDRYTLAELSSAINYIKSTGKPTTTGQQWKSYDSQELIDICDWMFPTIHPYWEAVYEPSAGVSFTVDHFSTIRDRSNKPVMVKEVGYPTGGNDNGCTEQSQATYYSKLAKSPIKFVYFEAFDGPWKKDINPTEPYWGLFDKDRNPKPVIGALRRR